MAWNGSETGLELSRAPLLKVVLQADYCAEIRHLEIKITIFIYETMHAGLLVISGLYYSDSVDYALSLSGSSTLQWVVLVALPQPPLCWQTWPQKTSFQVHQGHFSIDQRPLSKSKKEATYPILGWAQLPVTALQIPAVQKRRQRCWCQQ